MSTPSGAPSPAPILPARFHAVDALRGVAATMVLVFHLVYSSPQSQVVRGALPSPLTRGLELGRSGVAVFFVLSGFVIAHTTRNLGGRLRDVGRYSARRQLRLDPPYWAMIAVVLALGLAEHLVPGLVYSTFSLREVAENATYTQDLLHATPMLAVAWTLCLEVQFYLVMVLLVLAAGRFTGTGPDATPQRARLVRAGAWTLGAVSLVLSILAVPTGPWFIGLWWMFCLGATVCWFLHGDVGRTGTAIVLGCAAVAVVVEDLRGAGDPWAGEWFALGTALLLVGLGLANLLGAKPWRWLLYLGAISYSLYLVHLPVIDTLLGALFKAFPGTAGSLAALVVGAAASVGAAVLLHRFVEVPAIRLSRRLTTGRVRVPAGAGYLPTGPQTVDE